MWLIGLNDWKCGWCVSAEIPWDWRKGPQDLQATLQQQSVQNTRWNSLSGWSVKHMCQFNLWVCREYLKPWRLWSSTSEKEILPANNPNKEVLASELIERLIVRFWGEIQDELGDLNKKITHFVIQPDKKVCTGIDRLNGIIQKLTQLGQSPTDASKLAKLKEALEN